MTRIVFRAGTLQSVRAAWTARTARATLAARVAPAALAALASLSHILATAHPVSAAAQRLEQVAAQRLDVLFLDAFVLDGTGGPAFVADIGVAGSEIVAVGLLDGAEAERTIDATGLHVVPGFIDMHSHADRAFASDDIEARRAHNLVMQGITTSVFGPDGRNPTWPLADEIDAYRSLGVATNVVPMVGHGTVRRLVMGDDYERAATDAEVAEMAALVRSGMADGAWGLGAGPEYRPGRFSATEELIALAKVVAEYDGFYYAHQRSQSPLPLWQTPSMVDRRPLTGTDGMRETIEIGRAAGIRVVGTHIKAKGTDSWGHAAKDVLMIDAARAEGVQVYLDQYPYETFGGGPTDVLPAWAFAPPGTDRSGGLDDPLWRDEELLRDHKANLRAHLADPMLREELEGDTEYVLRLQGGADRHVVVLAPDFPAAVGRNLAEIAAEAGLSPFEQLVRFALDAHQLLPEGARFRPVAGHPFDVELYMRQEYTATSTDGFVSLETRPGQHPRSYGAFPRKIAHYARDRGVISLPFAIRSSTGLPAQIVGLTDRGCLRARCKADLVVFDYREISAPATIMEPDRYPTGITHVMVNGQFTVDDGEPTGALPGEVLDRRNRHGSE